MVDLHCGPCVDVGNRSGPGGREPAMLQGARRRVARAGGVQRHRADSELGRVLSDAQGAFLGVLGDEHARRDGRLELDRLTPRFTRREDVLRAGTPVGLRKHSYPAANADVMAHWRRWGVYSSASHRLRTYSSPSRVLWVSR